MALTIGPKTPFVLPGTDAYQFHSGVTDRDYEVLVTVMASGKPGTRYPVLYHPDGDLGPSFPVMVPLMQLGKELPGMIVVSVGYGLGGLVSDPVVLQRWATLRMTDLIPTLQPDGTGGGAPDFLRFISEELMPFVNANYPADADDCGLAGDSLGGLFALYAILASPGRFRRCLAGSPSIERSRDLLFSLEEQLAESGQDPPTRLFMGAGSLEGDPMLSNMNAMTDRLRSRGYSNFKLTAKVFDDETHVSVWPASFSRGLKAIFATD